MTVRAVQWQRLWEWGTAITVDNEHRRISLNLRAEDNLILLNGNNEIYVDLQLPDWTKVTDDLPVWVTTGRVIVADGRPTPWTVVSFKTTSWDNIRLLYGDNEVMMIDHGTGRWTEIMTDKDINRIIAMLRAEFPTRLSQFENDLRYDDYVITQDEYTWLPATKEDDGKMYRIYETLL